MPAALSAIGPRVGLETCVDLRAVSDGGSLVSSSSMWATVAEQTVTISTTNYDTAGNLAAGTSTDIIDLSGYTHHHSFNDHGDAIYSSLKALKPAGHLSVRAVQTFTSSVRSVALAAVAPPAPRGIPDPAQLASNDAAGLLACCMLDGSVRVYERNARYAAVASTTAAGSSSGSGAGAGPTAGASSDAAQNSGAVVQNSAPSFASHERKRNWEAVWPESRVKPTLNTLQATVCAWVPALPGPDSATADGDDDAHDDTQSSIASIFSPAARSNGLPFLLIGHKAGLALVSVDDAGGSIDGVHAVYTGDRSSGHGSAGLHHRNAGSSFMLATATTRTLLQTSSAMHGTASAAAVQAQQQGLDEDAPIVTSLCVISSWLRKHNGHAEVRSNDASSTQPSASRATSNSADSWSARVAVGFSNGQVALCDIIAHRSASPSNAGASTIANGLEFSMPAFVVLRGGDAGGAVSMLRWRSGVDHGISTDAAAASAGDAPESNVHKSSGFLVAAQGPKLTIYRLTDAPLTSSADATGAGSSTATAVAPTPQPAPTAADAGPKLRLRWQMTRRRTTATASNDTGGANSDSITSAGAAASNASSTTASRSLAVDAITVHNAHDLAITGLHILRRQLPFAASSSPAAATRPASGADIVVGDGNGAASGDCSGGSENGANAVGVTYIVTCSLDGSVRAWDCAALFSKHPAAAPVASVANVASTAAAVTGGPPQIMTLLHAGRQSDMRGSSTFPRTPRPLLGLSISPSGLLMTIMHAQEKQQLHLTSMRNDVVIDTFTVPLLPMGDADELLPATTAGTAAAGLPIDSAAASCSAGTAAAATTTSKIVTGQQQSKPNANTSVMQLLSILRAALSSGRCADLPTIMMLIGRMAAQMERVQARKAGAARLLVRSTVEGASNDGSTHNGAAADPVASDATLDGMGDEGAYFLRIAAPPAVPHQSKKQVQKQSGRRASAASTAASAEEHSTAMGNGDAAGMQFDGAGMDLDAEVDALVASAAGSASASSSHALDCWDPRSLEVSHSQHSTASHSSTSPFAAGIGMPRYLALQSILPILTLQAWSAFIDAASVSSSASLASTDLKDAAVADISARGSARCSLEASRSKMTVAIDALQSVVNCLRMAIHAGQRVHAASGAASASAGATGDTAADGATAKGAAGRGRKRKLSISEPVAGAAAASDAAAGAGASSSAVHGPAAPAADADSAAASSSSSSSAAAPAPVRPAPASTPDAPSLALTILGHRHELQHPSDVPLRWMWYACQAGPTLALALAACRMLVYLQALRSEARKKGFLDLKSRRQVKGLMVAIRWAEAVAEARREYTTAPSAAPFAAAEAASSASASSASAGKTPFILPSSLRLLLRDAASSLRIDVEMAETSLGTGADLSSGHAAGGTDGAGAGAASSSSASAAASSSSLPPSTVVFSRCDFCGAAVEFGFATRIQVPVLQGAPAAAPDAASSSSSASMPLPPTLPPSSLLASSLRSCTAPLLPLELRCETGHPCHVPGLPF